MTTFITSSGFVVILMCVYQVGCTSSFPDGFILDIKPACSQNTSSPATISVTTDYSINVELECKNDYLTVVDTTDGGTTYTGTVKYSGDSATECLFEKHPSIDVYKVVLIIYYGTLGSMIQTSSDRYLITCTYDDRTETNSSTSDIAESFLSPSEIQRHGGSTASSTFTLDVTDVVGNSLTTNIPLGKKIKLVAVMQDTVVNEVSAQAVSCSAVTGSYSYSILRGGCGDGVIFNRYSGFTTSGRTITSPFFSAFHLKKSNTIQFECNFTVCATACDGISCGDSAPSRRRRRSVEYGPTATESPKGFGENFVSVWTEYFILGNSPDKSKRKHSAVITPIKHHNNKENKDTSNKDTSNEDTSKEDDLDKDAIKYTNVDDDSERKVTSSVKHLGTAKINDEQLKRLQRNGTIVQTISCTKLRIVLLVGTSIFFLFILFLAWCKNSKTKEEPSKLVSPQSSLHI